jgi:hypothetical protein
MSKPGGYMNGHRASRDVIVPHASDAEDAVAQARMTSPPGWFWHGGQARHTPSERWPGAWTVRMHRLER